MSDDEKKGIKETEWSADKATLERIDRTLREYYNCRINKKYDLSLENLDILYGEGHVHFTKEELENCDKFQKEIDILVDKYSKHLYNSVIRTVDNSYTNEHYFISWGIINKISRAYWLYLMRCLQNHNLLMKTAKTGMQKFRGM